MTLHIDSAQLTRYGGNYSAFEEQRSQQLLLQQAAFTKQQDKIASKFGFEITDHSLYLYGICQACQKS